VVDKLLTFAVGIQPVKTVASVAAFQGSRKSRYLHISRRARQFAFLSSTNEDPVKWISN
jgi:hypothetical protein